MASKKKKRSKNSSALQITLICVSIAIGFLTHLTIQKYGNFLVKRDAGMWGLTVGLFVYCSQIALRDRWVSNIVGLAPLARLALIGFGFAHLGTGIYLATHQVQRGYPTLTREMLNDQNEIDGKHFTVESDLNLKRIYRSSGYLGALSLVPMKDFGHRVVLMVAETPVDKRLRATGKLRQDVRLVQRRSEGKVDGPFLQEYREAMDLDEHEQIWFLDTSSRVGLNFTFVLWLLGSLLWTLFFVRTRPLSEQVTGIKGPPPSRIH